MQSSTVKSMLSRALCAATFAGGFVLGHETLVSHGYDHWDRSHAARVAEAYWTDLARHDYQSAYGELSNHLQLELYDGDERQLEKQMNRDPVLAAEVHVRVKKLDADVAVADVDRMVTQNLQSGCVRWEGEMTLRKEATGWKIDDKRRLKGHKCSSGVEA